MGHMTCIYTHVIKLYVTTKCTQAIHTISDFQAANYIITLDKGYKYILLQHGFNTLASQ